MSKIEDLHYTIMKLLELRKPVSCPECGSDEWFAYEEHIRTYREYDDGHYEYITAEYMCTTWQCDDCGYDCD